MHLLNMPDQRALVLVHCVTELTRKRLRCNRLANAVCLGLMQPQILSRRVLLTADRAIVFGVGVSDILRVHSVVVTVES